MQRQFLRQSQIKLMNYPVDACMVYRWFAQVPAPLGYDRADPAVPKRRKYLQHSHYVRKDGLVRFCRVCPVGFQSLVSPSFIPVNHGLKI